MTIVVHNNPDVKAAELVVQVTGPDFCAAIVIAGDRCIAAAPILKWCVGKSRNWLSVVFRNKGWRAVSPRIKPPPVAPKALPEPRNPDIGVKRLPDGSIDQNYRISTASSYGAAAWEDERT